MNHADPRRKALEDYHYALILWLTTGECDTQILGNEFCVAADVVLPTYQASSDDFATYESGFI